MATPKIDLRNPMTWMALAALVLGIATWLLPHPVDFGVALLNFVLLYASTRYYRRTRRNLRRGDRS